MNDVLTTAVRDRSGVKTLLERYVDVRCQSKSLCEPLEAEDCVIQSMPDVSPTRWHLAHTTWFFETFVLAAANESYEPFDPSYGHLFNSYYNQIGEQFPRPKRGLLSRPTVAEVFEYRRFVDVQMAELFKDSDSDRLGPLLSVIEIGIHHEQQHQELIITDIKHVFSCNPLYPAYRETTASPPREATPLDWHSHDEGLYEIGHAGGGFAYDNESPRHRVFLEAYRLASRLVTNGEYLAFVEDGGYRRPELWLSEGWRIVGENGWRAPLYWIERDGGWQQFTLSGLRPLDLAEPVCHVSYFEADAFARWSESRLPTEAEWETAVEGLSIEGNFVESGTLHPAVIETRAKPAAPAQMFGDAWEWTSSPYTAYPGYRAPEGALGEYNGKFMCNQYVMRGGSCATPQSHIRAAYRNFFPPDARWQFTGIRLAR